MVLGIAADIMKAHRRFLHAEEDHGYLGCKADSYLDQQSWNFWSSLCGSAFWSFSWSDFPNGDSYPSEPTMFPTPLRRRLEAGGWRSQQTRGPLDPDSGVDHGGYALQLEEVPRGHRIGLCRFLDGLWPFSAGAQ